MNSFILPIIFFFWSHNLLEVSAPRAGRVEVTNLTCQTFDPTFATIPKCELNKRPGRRMAFSFHTKLNQRIDNMTVFAKLLQLVNRKYKTFLYEDQIDFCSFLASVKRHFFWGIIMETVLKTSNINHTCPYDDSFTVNNFSFEGKHFTFLPLPKGNYKIDFLLVIRNSSKLKYELMCEKH